MAKHRADTIEAPPQQPLLVVGSHDWDNWGAMETALAEIIGAHPNILIITGGCPTGAEWFARQKAEAYGWPMRSMRDEDMLKLENAIVLGFIKGVRPSATEALLQSLRVRFWTRIIRDEVHPQRTGWEDR